MAIINSNSISYARKASARVCCVGDAKPATFNEKTSQLFSIKREKSQARDGSRLAGKMITAFDLLNCKLYCVEHFSHRRTIV
jgi:hypothetical protein